MKLYDILKLSGSEITVCDKDYDMETYFYGEHFFGVKEPDVFDQAMLDLSKLLEVMSISMDCITVNLSEVIEQNLGQLAKTDLFDRTTLDAIMDDLPFVFAGDVPGSWMRAFVDALKPVDDAGAEKNQ